MTPDLGRIQAKLRAAADHDALAATTKFIPTAQRAYGVRVAVLNALAREYRGGGFDLVEALWQSGAFEERLLAAKLLGHVAQSDPRRALKFLASASADLSDWAVCDTLATQGVRTLVRTQRNDLFELAGRLLKSTAVWERRFGVVLLLNFAKIRNERRLIRKMLLPLRDDPEPYVKKALTWIDKDLAVG